MGLASPLPVKGATVQGVLCGIGAAFCWAAGFVAAHHAVEVGLSPVVIALHRYIWAGLALSPFVVSSGLRDLGGIGWARGVLFLIFGGVPFAILSYSGFLLVPLGHGAVIQPACAAVSGLALASLILKEALPFRRVLGAMTIVIGLVVLGVEALRTIGAHGVFGDFIFVTTGLMFAVFGMLLRLWRIEPLRATAITSVLSLAALPAFLFYFDNMRAAGFGENLLQALVQGILSGTGGTFLFTRAVSLIGAGRATLFSSLVPILSLLIGFLALGEVPSVSQLIGLAIVLVGFRLTQKD